MSGRSQAIFWVAALAFFLAEAGDERAVSQFRHGRSGFEHDGEFCPGDRLQPFVANEDEAGNQQYEHHDKPSNRAAVRELDAIEPSDDVARLNA